MIEPFESSGVWWLPDDDAGRVAGTLRYTHEDGIRLDLLGTFGAGGGAEFGTKNHGVILGLVAQSPGGKSVTLKGCRQARYTTSSSGLNTESYRVERAFLGWHLVRADDFHFSHCELSTSGLNTWAFHLTGLQTQYGDHDSHVGEQFRVTYTPPQPLRAAIPDGAITFSLGATLLASGLRECSLHEQAHIDIESVRPLEEDQWNLRYVYPLLNLLTLATDVPNVLTEYQLSDEKVPARSVKVVGARVFSAKEVDAGDVPGRMLVPLKAVQPKFAELVPRWLTTAERFKDACNVFFALRYAPGAYLDVRLMNNCQALELYDARRTGNGHAGAAQMPQEILASLPAEASEALRRWSEGVTIDPFPAVLKRLATEHETTLGPLGPNGLIPLIDAVLRFRNYVLFRMNPPVDREYYGRGLYLATETLACLMKSCFLAELGFTPEERRQLFARNANYDFLGNEWAAAAGRWRP